MTFTLTPENFEKNMKIIYSQVIEAEKNNFVITVDRISPSKQSFQERMNDPENTSYGPFTAQEFEKKMTSWMTSS